MPAITDALAEVCTAATSISPASPAQAPPSAHARATSLSVASPTSRAARALPPTTRSEKPCAVKLSQARNNTHATTPSTRPQCTSPGNESGAIGPIWSAAARGRVDGLLRLAGSRIGPSTPCLNSAIAM